jgi:hypothetical protein
MGRVKMTPFDPLNASKDLQVYLRYNQVEQTKAQIYFFVFLASPTSVFQK